MAYPDRAEKNPMCAAVIDLPAVGHHCFLLWASEKEREQRLPGNKHV